VPWKDSQEDSYIVKLKAHYTVGEVVRVDKSRFGTRVVRKYSFTSRVRGPDRDKFMMQEAARILHALRSLWLPFLPSVLSLQVDCESCERLVVQDMGKVYTRDTVPFGQVRGRRGSEGQQGHGEGVHARHRAMVALSDVGLTKVELFIVCPPF